MSNSQVAPNYGRRAVWLILALGAVSVILALVSGSAENFLTFNITQLLVLGIILLVGAVLLLFGQFANISAGTIGSVIIGIGITAMIVSIVLGLGRLASDFLSFDLTQILALGAVFVVVGLIVRNWLISTNRVNVPQRIGWIVIVLGLVGIITGLVANSVNLLGFSAVQLLALGVIFAVVGILILIFFSGNIDPVQKPMAQLRTAPVKSSAPSAPSMPSTPVQPTRTVVTTQAVPSTPSAAPAPAARATNKLDDLLIIEGIGPKSKEALYKSGITSFEQIANLTPDDLYRIIKIEGGVNLVSDTKTWPKQARLLADGKVKEFEEYVKYLVSSRDSNNKS
jgi:predicted flap endonuclease-1-like 5' DNA nuclease